MVKRISGGVFMQGTFYFVFNSILLGFGLAMDASSVSIADGIQNASMKRREMVRIAGTFSFFQWLMPLLGWFCVHEAVRVFSFMERFIPWIALLLLAYIGGGMLREGIEEYRKARKAEGDPERVRESSYEKKLAWKTLILQGIATSIDALSVGFAIAEYTAPAALAASLIIAAVTMAVCLFGVRLGRKAGDLLSSRAAILGGCILIFIGLEIFIRAMLGL
jgi:putative Mn2+ efflux pump MntP